MSEETPQKGESEVAADQGEARNDVVVKIGLVGDAQVSKLDHHLLHTHQFISTKSIVPYVRCQNDLGWKDNTDG